MQTLNAIGRLVGDARRACDDGRDGVWADGTPAWRCARAATRRPRCTEIKSKPSTASRLPRPGHGARRCSPKLRKLWRAPRLARRATLRDLLCDPQTSGGLLVAVAPEHAEEVSSCCWQSAACPARPSGACFARMKSLKVVVTVAYGPAIWHRRLSRARRAAGPAPSGRAGSCAARCLRATRPKPNARRSTPNRRPTQWRAFRQGPSA